MPAIIFVALFAVLYFAVLVSACRHRKPFLWLLVVVLTVLALAFAALVVSGNLSRSV